MDEPKKIKVISRPAVSSDTLETFKKVLRDHLETAFNENGECRETNLRDTYSMQIGTIRVWIEILSDAITASDLIPVQEDFYLERILRRSKDFKEALKIVIEIAVWRKNFAVKGS